MPRHPTDINHLVRIYGLDQPNWRQRIKDRPPKVGLRTWRRVHRQCFILDRERNHRDAASDSEEEEPYFDQVGGALDDNIIQSANLQGHIQQYTIKGNITRSPHEPSTLTSVKNFLDLRAPVIRRAVQIEVRKRGPIKIRLELSVNVYQPNQDGPQQEDIQLFHSWDEDVKNPDEVYKMVNRCIDEISSKFDNWMANGSGWKLLNIAKLRLDVRDGSSHVNIQGGEGFRIFSQLGSQGPGSFIPSPVHLAKKKCLINPHNTNDDYCAHYCLAGYQHLLDNPTLNLEGANFYRRLVKSYPFIEGKCGPFHYDGKWPIHPVRDMRRLERLNPGYAFPVLGYDNLTRKFHWVRFSPLALRPNHHIIYFLVLYDDKRENYHYTVVKPDGIKTLLASSRHCKVCPICLWETTGKKAMRDHIEMGYCTSVVKTRTVLPDLGENYLTFKEYSKKMPVDFYMIADTEQALVKVTGDGRVKHRHVPLAYGVLLVCTYDESFKPMYTRRRVEAKDFDPDTEDPLIARRMLEDIVMMGEHAIQHRSRHEYPVPHLSMAQQREYDNATHCHICGGPWQNFHNPIWDKKPKQGKKQNSKKRKAPENESDEGESGESEDEEEVEEKTDVDPATKVRDHDHRFERFNFRGAAHAGCNLQFQSGWKEGRPTRSWKIPVLFHNFKFYDSHILVRALRDSPNLRGLSIVPQKGESVLTLSFGNYQINDSMAIIQSSLDKAMETCYKELEENNFDPNKIRSCYPALVNHFEQVHMYNRTAISVKNMKFRQLLGKGVFPYEYIDHVDRLEETALPPIESFHSLLRGKTVSQEEYNRAQYMWKLFNCRNIGDYMDVYLDIDIFGLQGLVEMARQAEFQASGLEVLKFLTAPSLSMAALLLSRDQMRDSFDRFIPFRLELCPATDLGAHVFALCEKNKRGGITQICHRYSKADKDTEIKYLDITNLYGAAMMEPLPMGSWSRWNQSQLDLYKTHPTERLKLIDTEGDFCYIATVDAEVPTHLHDYFSDYPPMPVKRCVKLDETSPHYRTLLNGIVDSKGKPMLRHEEKSEKLILDLLPKKGYVIHLRLLQAYIEEGVVVTRLEDMIFCRQQRWMKSYIETNTEKRNEARKAGNTALANGYKLKNNSCYGKMMQDDRKHKNLKIITNELMMGKVLRHPLTNEVTLIRTGENLLAIADITRKELKLDKPLPVGFCILEISKWLMFRYFYGSKRKLKHRMRLLMTDTDSVVLEVTKENGEDFLTTCVKNGLADEWLDMSVYKDTEPAVVLMKQMGLDPLKNKAKVGTMKDECPNDPIVEFVGLRPKMYAYRTAQEVTMKAKGVPGTVLSAHHDFDSYKACLQADSSYIVQRHKVHGIHSKLHELRTDVITKQTLSPLDSKRWMMDTINTLPFGHWRTQEMGPYLEWAIGYEASLPKDDELVDDMNFLDLDNPVEPPSPPLVGIEPNPGPKGGRDLHSDKVSDKHFGAMRSQEQKRVDIINRLRSKLEENQPGSTTTMHDLPESRHGVFSPKNFGEFQVNIKYDNGEEKQFFFTSRKKAEEFVKQQQKEAEEIKEERKKIPAPPLVGIEPNPGPNPKESYDHQWYCHFMKPSVYGRIMTEFVPIAPPNPPVIWPTYPGPVRCSTLLYEWMPIKDICFMVESFLGYRMVPHFDGHRSLVACIENLYTRTWEEMALAGCEMGNETCREYQCVVCQGDSSFLTRLPDSAGFFSLDRPKTVGVGMHGFLCEAWAAPGGLCCCFSCEIEKCIRNKRWRCLV